MNITVILEAQTKPNKKISLLEALTQLLPETAKYKGFIDIDIYSEETTETVFFISKWQSIEDYQSYLQWRTETGVMETLSSLLVSPPNIRFLTKSLSNDFKLIKG